MASGLIGSEFLPHLDEGAIWARATLAPSTGPTGGTNVMDRARIIMASFPEVTQVVSQVGRPDDGHPAVTAGKTVAVRFARRSTALAAFRMSMTSCAFTIEDVGVSVGLA